MLKRIRRRNSDAGTEIVPGETANLFVEVYAPVLRSSLPTASAAICILDELFTMLEFRAALRRVRRSSASDPDRKPFLPSFG